MTSINALKFDFHTGVLGCDEQRHWNEEKLKIYAADKILPVIEPHITEKYRITAAYGNTGTSGIGDELRITIRRNVTTLLESKISEDDDYPERFIDMDDLAALVFDTITAVKHKHVNDSIMAKYGITTEETVSTANGGPFIEKAMEEITGNRKSGVPDPVFGNLGILAGYDPVLGFRIYLYSMRENFWVPVPDRFMSQGSGGDSAQLVLSSFFAAHPEETIERTDGLIALLSAIDHASRHNPGVGGYFNILIIDGKAEPSLMMRQINDHRSKLGTEVVRLLGNGFLPEEISRRIVDELFFMNGNPDEIEKLLWNSVDDRKSAHRFLRGYPATGRVSF